MFRRSVQHASGRKSGREPIKALEDYVELGSRVFRREQGYHGNNPKL
jgi:hypothetical protein